ncbi:MAG: cyclic nucleotide-binding domain-containing protein [Calothrix sp. MO_167.B12]|nr:cyclic nucleotide-binding domain-containing protein [Calothrix sp. MO_167.B12]
MLKPAKTVEIYQKSPSPKTYAAGEVIFKAEEVGEVMYGVIEGEVDIWVNDKVVETISTGDVFGEGALVHQDHKRASTAIAKTDCQLGFLNREHFLFAVQQTPMFALEVMRSYSDRLRRLKYLL